MAIGTDLAGRIESPYGYIIKPFELPGLDAAIRMALARREAESEITSNERRLRLATDAAINYR